MSAPTFLYYPRAAVAPAPFGWQWRIFDGYLPRTIVGPGWALTRAAAERAAGRRVARHRRQQLRAVCAELRIVHHIPVRARLDHGAVIVKPRRPVTTVEEVCVLRSVTRASVGAPVRWAGDR